MRRNLLPSAGSTARSVFKFYNGGHAAGTAGEAIVNLDSEPASSISQPNGIAGLDAGPKLRLSNLPDSVVVGRSISGPASLAASAVGTYTITDYDDFFTYDVSATLGTVSILDDIITYTAPETGGPAGFIVNGKPVLVTVISFSVDQAAITSPIDTATNILGTVTFTGSAFSVTGGSDTHESSDWQLATDSGFTAIVQQTAADAANKTSWTVTGLLVDTIYYVRVRYKGVTYGYGAWSPVSSFTTKSSFIPTAEIASKVASLTASGTQLGNNVSISGDGTRLIVGEHLNSAGKAYIFVLNAGVWTEEAVLTGPTPLTTDFFGQGVVMDSTGTRVAIAAPQRDDGGSNTGSVYIYLRTGTSWALEATLVSTPQEATGLFGWGLAFDKDATRLVAGAYQFDAGGQASSGASFVFLRTGTTWAQEAMLSASDLAANSFFGTRHDITADGSRIIVAARQADPSALTDAGQAYIFSRSGTTWTEEAILTASDKTTSDHFGWAVSIDQDGTRAVVTATEADAAAVSTAGAAYVFIRSGTTWTEEAKLIATTPINLGALGYSVAMNYTGDVFIVGAAKTDPGSLADAGSAYIFTRSGTSWTQAAELLASDKAAGDNFGISVSITEYGDKAVISAPLSDLLAASAGRFYIFN